VFSGRPRIGGAREAAGAVARLAGRGYPRISSIAGPCVYVRREAFELLGDLAGAGDLEGSLRELATRALERGMLHVAADDVYVGATGEPLEDPSPSSPILPGDSREPPAASLLDLDLGDETSAVRRALTTAQVALGGLSVTLDARALGPALGGTQVYTVELALALARLGGISLRAVVAPDLPSATAQALTDASIELVPYAAAAHDGLARSHVVHRPQQVFSADDVNLLRLLGERVVISHQDLIAYRNPAYHARLEDWQRHRRVTRMALAVADRVAFFSGHALRDVVGEGLLCEERAVETGIGSDQLWSRGLGCAQRPQRAPEGESYLLCLGADYGHKNRPFAIALLAALRELGGWQGSLVFAGAHVEHGSSAEEERAWRSAHPQLGGAVIDCGPVSEEGRAWLMEHARATVYPSLYEGFGLLPFEAARARVPCLYAPQAALAETAGEAAATLVPWDPRSSARAVLPLLEDGAAREAHLALLDQAARRRSWRDVAARMREVYEQAVSSPHRGGARRAWQELGREQQMVELSDAAASLGVKLRELQDSVGLLAGAEHGGVLTEAQRRGLLRVASRGFARRAVLGPISLLGRRW